MHDLSLSGRTALVTGGGRGMGRAIGEALAQEGVSVIVADVNSENAQTTAAGIVRAGGQAEAVTLDISDIAAMRRAFEEFDRRYERIDIAVLAAGVIRAKSLLDHTEDDWDHMANVNLKGTFFSLQETSRRMIQAKTGVILTLCSTSAFVSSRVPEIVYDVTKGGIRQMTISAAVELAPHGIRVNSLAPGTIVTDFNRATLQTPESVQAAEAHLPMGRLGAPADVVAAALYLCSEGASYVTGHHLVIDGGRLARAG